MPGREVGHGGEDVAVAAEPPRGLGRPLVDLAADAESRAAGGGGSSSSSSSAAPSGSEDEDDGGGTAGVAPRAGRGCCRRCRRRRRPIGKGAEGLGAQARQVLRRNPELWKVVVAAGLQQSAATVANTLVLSVLMGRLWGNSMSQITSVFGMAINIVAAVCGGPFGRFSDKVDRRLAVAIYGVGSFLSAWALLIFGLNTRGLWAAVSAQVIGAAGTASNVLVALANDVTSVDDREIAFGVFLAGTNALVFLLIGIPALLISVLKVISDMPMGVLAYQVVLSGGFFACISCVAPQSPKDKEKGQAQESESGGEGNGDGVESGPDGTCADLEPRKRDAVLEPLKLIFLHRQLRRLCLVSFMLSLAGTCTLAISGQFYNQALGLIPYGTDREFAMVAVLSMLPGQIMVLPGLFISGFLAKQRGTLRLLRTLIPVTALLTLVAAGLALVKEMWFLPIVVIAQSYGGLAFMPLTRLVAGCAPPGRTGEALSASGVSMQVAGLVGNTLVASLNPAFKRHNAYHLLWIYYPICSGLVLASLLPLLRRPAGGWGAAAGATEDQFSAAVFAAVAARRWMSRIRARRERQQARHGSSRNPTLQ